MFNRDDLINIFERICNGSQTKEDIAKLRQSLTVDGNVVQFVSQDGKFNTNIGQITGGEVHLGDRIYQGADAEAIKEALRLVLQEKQKAKRPRKEKLLLQAVKDEVVARQKQSLHNAVLINLGKEAQPEQVKRPWSSDIKIGDKPSQAIPDEITILEVFDQEEIAGRLLILGNPGAGKTTTMLELAQQLCNRAEQQADYPIPVLFNLSLWKDERQLIKDWLAVELRSKYGVRIDIGKKWLDNRQLLPILDGLDELEPHRQELCVHSINQLLRGENFPLYLIVCSRSEEYAAYETKLQLNGAICLQPLTSEQVQDYLNTIKQPELWSIIRHDANLLTLVHTPLILSITVLANQEISLHRNWQALKSTNERLQYLLGMYVRRMLNRPMFSKAYSVRSTPNIQKTQLYLTWLAKQLEQDAQTEFSVDKIQPLWISTKISRFSYIFLSAIISEIIIWLPFGIFLEFFFEVRGGLIYSLIISFFLSCIGIFLGKSNLMIEPSEVLRWSLRKITMRLAGGLLIGLLFAGFAGFLGYVSLPISGFIGIIGLIFSLICGLIVGPILGLVIGLDTSLESLEMEVRITSNAGIWRSARNTILVGLPVGLLIGFYVGLFALFLDGLNGLIFGIIVTLVCGLSFGTKFGGGKACIQHFVLRTIFYFEGYIPWNYSRFLNSATERLLLQRNGGRYRFMHKLLQEYFSTNSINELIK